MSAREEKKRRRTLAPRISGKEFSASSPAVPRLYRWIQPTSKITCPDPLLHLFLHLASFRLRLLYDLFLQLSRDNVIVVHLHVEAAAPLSHRRQVGAVCE